MEYKNILFPLHTFKDNHMVKIEQRIAIVPIKGTSDCLDAYAKDGWYALSVSVSGEMIAILLQRLPIIEEKEIKDY